MKAIALLTIALQGRQVLKSIWRLKGLATQRCIVLLCVLAPLVSCSRASKAHVLATVGDRIITVEDLAKEVERRGKNHRPIPDKETLLQEMVNYEAMLQRAQKSGVADDPQVRRELNNLLIA